MEVAQVAVAHRFPNFVHMEGGVFQKVGCLGQAFFLQQFPEGFPCPALDLPTEPIEVIVECIRDFCQTAGAVVLFDITKNLHSSGFLCGTRYQPVRMVQQLHKKQSHGSLADAAAVRRSPFCQRPNEIFYQVLYGKDIGNLKIQTVCVPGRIAKTVHDEIP